MNAVEREPVPTRVLNPNATEASYKPKQRSYKKTKLKKKKFFFFFSGGFYPGTIYICIHVCLFIHIYLYIYINIYPMEIYRDRQPHAIEERHIYEIQISINTSEEL